MPYTPSVASPTDLRAPVITKLRQGIGVGSLRVVVLVGLDTLLISLAWSLAQVWGTPVMPLQLWNVNQKPGLLLPILLVTLGLVAASGFYGNDTKRRDLWGLIKVLTLGQAVLLLVAFLYQPGLLVISRSSFILSWLLTLILVCSGRMVVDLLIRYLRRQGAARWPIFLIGHPEDTQRACKLLATQERYKVLGQTDLATASNTEWSATLEHIRQLGVSEVFVCSWQALPEPMFVYWDLQRSGIRLRVLPMGLELPRRRAEVKMLGSLPTIQFALPSIIGSDFWLKRGFDLVVASLILLVLGPLYCAIALWIKRDSPGPVFYRQTRIGLKGQPFKVWKFRTMVCDAEALQKELEASNEMKDGVLFKMKEDPRITGIGKFLRRYSLDELPQVFNVLAGEMSLVGPRPFPMRDVERFSTHHFIRQEVLPGITGLWQVSGRSDIVDFEDVVRLDVAYIQNWSLALDFEILLQTIKVVLAKQGAY
ncbi:sugar transferase [Anthocerotibacter panamensis]|uniref:sugar transferase n=1 Tax=Anthocerotibacter panamensis TaxID=2857077 RepID=UPI001C405201|nr:sugar transferase [Anthocerotibacter panamensis]